MIQGRGGCALEAFKCTSHAGKRFCLKYSLLLRLSSRASTPPQYSCQGSRRCHVFGLAHAHSTAKCYESLSSWAVVEPPSVRELAGKPSPRAPIRRYVDLWLCRHECAFSMSLLHHTADLHLRRRAPNAYHSPMARTRLVTATHAQMQITLGGSRGDHAGHSIHINSGFPPTTISLADRPCHDDFLGGKDLSLGAQQISA